MQSPEKSAPERSGGIPLRPGPVGDHKGLSKNTLYKSRRRRISELAHFLLKMRCFADSPRLNRYSLFLDEP